MDNHRIAIATVSLGWHNSHTLPDKLKAAAKHKFQGVEMVHSDLEKESARLNLSMIETAQQTRQQLDDLGLEVVSLSPFENYEGSRTPLSQRLRTAFDYIAIARILRSPIVQVPASWDHASLAVSDETIVSELRHLADAALPRPGSDEATITIAYEPMSWSVRCDTWQKALELKHRVARENFKLCLDTYHILTKLWGDCTASDGKIPGGDEAIAASLREMRWELRPRDVAFIQLSDAEKMSPAIQQQELNAMEGLGDGRGKHSCWHWSGVGRIFPFDVELGAYLPMKEILKEWLVDLGWKGWVSMEIFHRSMDEEEKGPEYWARKGMESWRKCGEAVK